MQAENILDSVNELEGMLLTRLEGSKKLPTTTVKEALLFIQSVTHTGKLLSKIKDL